MEKSKKTKSDDKAFKTANGVIALVMILGLAVSALGLRSRARQAVAAAQIAPEQVVLTWEKAGGVSGKCEILQIQMNGQASLAPCAASQGQEAVSFQLDHDQLAQLQRWVQDWYPFEARLSEPGISIPTQVHLTLRGSGRHPVSRQEQLQVEKFIEEVIRIGSI